jgi:glycosyltransferase involved in cell wall biosynthesis
MLNEGNGLVPKIGGKVRVGFLNTHPIQYFAPLYAYLNRSEDLAITVLYLSDYSVRGAQDHAFGRVVKWDIDLLSGYDARFITGAATREELSGFFSMVVPAVWKEIRRSGLDALVVHGHSPAAQLVGIAAAKASGIPVFMRGETHLGLSRGSVKALLRKFVMRAFYARLNGVLAIGSANKAFYRAMGVPERRIFPTPYTVDNSRFMQAARITDRERVELRAMLGVRDERPILLYSAKFEDRKCPGDLLRAAAQLNRDGAVFQLAMIGSGAMEAELRSLATALGMGNVHFHGFVNQSAIPRIYAACDVFVLPSKNEPWGLAINEAMCAGLPIVASAEVGCVPDLIRDGVNGRTFPAGNIGMLASVLRCLIDDSAARHAMALASRDIISGWSFAEVGEGLRMALRSVGLSALPSRVTAQ